MLFFQNANSLSNIDIFASNSFWPLLDAMLLSSLVISCALRNFWPFVVGLDGAGDE